jgi:hypothetical protein
MKSITDKPIKSIAEDLLQIEVYGNALSNFILESDTPITIGLQGEWGTGKTSLMSIIRENISKNNVASSWVNTWEFSLFADSANTTPRILDAMLGKLEENCKLANNWDIGDEVNQTVKNVSRFLSNIANQVITKQTGINIQGAANAANVTQEKIEIAEIKKQITLIINKLISSPNNPYKKVTFFVDDLDRIPPTDAVDVLEALKNIFDIPHCVFILAIDYDVVVKGLESKFGPKTDANEREFRSFFDKIIQVPFSMPVGAYDIKNFLTVKLKEVGIILNADDAENYAYVVKHTIGTNPRSLKRYLNSYSLINNVRALQVSDNEVIDDFMLFTLLGIQISFPQIFRLLTHEADYKNWSKGFSKRYGVDWEQLQEQIEQFGDNELLDETWEQVVFGVSQKDPYLRSRVFDVLNILNKLRAMYGDDVSDEIEKAMEFASITNVDDDLESKQAASKGGKRLRFDGLEEKIIQLTEEGRNPQGIEAYKTLFEPFIAEVNEANSFRVSLAPTGASFYDDSLESRGVRQQIYVENPSKRKSGIKMYVKASTGLAEDLHQYILELMGEIDTEHMALTFPVRGDKNQNPDLSLYSSLASELGDERYINLLKKISADIVEVCRKRQGSK